MHLKKDMQQLHIPPGCQGTFPHHLVTSDYSVLLDTNIVHYEWDWDHISFLLPREMEQMGEGLKQIGELRLHQPDLADLQYLTQLGMAQTILATRSSTSEWAFNIAGAAFITSFVVILGCLCFCACSSHCLSSRNH